MAEILTAYLKDIAGRPFAYGTDDCSTFVVSWLDRLTGKAGLKVWAGQFFDRDACEAFIARNGGFTAIADDFFAATYGVGRATAAKPGNVVLAARLDVTAMGIRIDAEQVALRTERGIRIARNAAIVAEWEAPTCRP